MEFLGGPRAQPCHLANVKGFYVLYCTVCKKYKSTKQNKDRYPYSLVRNFCQHNVDYHPSQSLSASRRQLRATPPASSVEPVPRILPRQPWILSRARSRLLQPSGTAANTC